jgi:N-acetylmuramic acid 6-phosphate etherase
MAAMSTEAGLARYRDAETWPTEEGLAAMLDHQGMALFAVRQALPALAAAVAAAASRLTEGGRGHHNEMGRLVYAGAGASGRLAVQDGVELYPTFGWPHHRLATLVAGGDAALTRSVEGAEDDADGGTAAADALHLGPHDVLLALAASGNTPWTCAVLAAARRAGAVTVGLANNAGSRLLMGAEYPVFLATGAEFLPGSTRLAAGTAQKIALNLFSTRLMTELGRVYRGLMVGVVPSNAKLVERAKRIVAALTGVAPDTAAHAYEAADGDIKLAVLMLDGLGRTVAQARLDAAGGDLRRVRNG